mmetsp:Transcript_33950/g.33104  ORF Transcript_33950/g.33104 Transcript_33950/m.33104 type:complete len:81 (+) Transcript_33950:2003-2245(+)
MKELIKKDRELKPPEKDVDVGEHLASVEDLSGYPLFPPNNHSLLKKHLTKELWLLLKDKKDEVGYSFRQSIFSGCKHSDS